MPLSSEPPRPPDGVGRQAIRASPPAAEARPVDRLMVGRRRALGWALVVSAVNVVVRLANVLVGGWRPLDVWLVGLSTASVVGLAVVLVASRSGGPR
jgi:hypothetical protein